MLALWLVVGCGSSSDANGLPSAGTGGTTTGGAGGAGGGPPLDPPYSGPPGAWTNSTPCPAPAAWPPATDYIPGAYDSTRGKIVYFTNNAGSPNTELWDWDGRTATFVQRTPCSFVNGLPPVRAGFGSAYDPLRKVVVIYGEVQRLNQDIAVLEFDPATGKIVDRSPAMPAFDWPRGDQPVMFFDSSVGSVVILALPKLFAWDPALGTWKSTMTITSMAPGGIGYSWAYDDARHKVYTFGESASKVAVAELDLTTGQWLSRTPSPLPAEWPTPANISSGCFDSKRDRMVMFGGSSAVVPATWEWDAATGAVKQFVAPSSEAMPRGGEAVFDAASGRVTVATPISPDGYLHDLWTWDGARWTSHRPGHVTLTWPAQPRIEPNESAFALAYDTDRKKTVLFQHPRAKEASGTTMEWDGSAWVDRTPPDSGQSPPARFGHAMAFDASRRRTVLFGGVGEVDRLRDVWEWDGAAGTWTNRTPTPLPASWPGGRTRPALVYDPSARTTLMFGGVGDDDTWSWDGATATWTRRLASGIGGGPFSPRASAIAYDDRLGHVVLIDYRFDALEAWSFDQATSGWRSLAPPAGVAPEKGPLLWFFAAAYDRVRGTTLVPGAGSAGVELWAYDSAGRRFANETPAPPPTDWPPPLAIDEVGAVAYDSDRGVFELLFRNGRLVERPSR